ncbi:DUF262 domain-containing protein [Niallia taxi]|uniref:DUF262 domain-containing protein n=1 Tax=Niallia taxi TaxID=2499688 RepID=UPI00203D55B6|nr:DUF262 domain-containing protein [Niallia taxi]MCM3217787.1 DUF262 domain-containing protein [Niallia taxi]
MYQINSQSAKTLTDGGNVRLPRFQRKQTWNDKKNFMLCISIFNDYPIGMFVLNREKLKTKNGIVDTLWLLDGRQRRNALTKILDNPENIYTWAKAYIKFKNTDAENEIEDKFWGAVTAHLETDEDNESDKNDNSPSTETGEIESDTIEIIDDDDYDESDLGLIVDSSEEVAATLEGSTNDIKTNLGLKLLLQIIITCHKINKKNSGFSKPFDFSNYFIALDYVKKDSEGKDYLDGASLTNFITAFNNYTDRQGLDDFEMEVFIDFLCTRYILKQESNMKSNLVKKINYSWDKIKSIIILVRQISLKLHNSKIGVIELSNVKSSDAQNIFKLINSSGTTLAAVEILSAKPSWNRKIIHPSNDLETAVDKLYKTLNVKREGIVRWDFPATLVDRLRNLDFIFKEFNYAVDSEFKTKVTLGFKILASIFENGVTKEKISSMSRSTNVDWDEIETIVRDLELMGGVLKNEAFFQYLKSWNTSLIELTSEAISINYLALIYRNWFIKGKPMGNGTKYEAFKKEAFALFDRMIYEYVLKQWRGSSDSKIADNILNFNPNDTFRAITQDRWISLLKELIDKETIQDQKAEQKEIKPILYYYYILSNKLAPDDPDKNYEMDHIIPKLTFNSSTGTNKHHVDNICNFCLLRKQDNNAKKTNSLHTIAQLATTDQNYKLMQQRISNSTDIPENEFHKFNTAQDFETLVTLRKQNILNAFKNNRSLLLN